MHNCCVEKEEMPPEHGKDAELYLCEVILF